MKANWLSLLLLPWLLSSACSKAPQPDLPAAMIWHKDQNLIHPAGGTMNIWEGFRVDQDVFTAEHGVSRFILWRNHGKRTPIAIEYSLRGGAAGFAANDGKRQTLPPAAAFRWAQFNLPLKQGFNFLEFTKSERDSLKIKAIRIGSTMERKEPHLAAGQGFDLFLLPGRGRLELSGRGTVEIAWQQASGETLAASREVLRSGFFSRKIVRDLSFSRPGLLSVKAKQGRFNIRSYSYAQQAAPEAPAKFPFQGKPNIYFVLADACQASHLGTYGYRRDTSPHLDAFARDAMVYENAYANATFTRSSVSTILTGLYPEHHHTHQLRSILPKELLTLPEFLKAKSYSTCIFSANVVNSPRGGFSQGVDVFDLISQKFNAPKEISVFSAFRRWLDTTPPAHFCYMHFVHPHLPFTAPSDFPVSFRPGKEKVTQARLNELKRKKRLAGLPRSAEEIQEIIDGYDASIAWMDSEFGKIVALLKKKGLYDDSMIVFLADHGEAMNEHGILGHGSNVYDETSRVPLIIKYPLGMSLTGRARPIAQLADLFPTIAARFRQSLSLDGRDLLADSLPGESDERIAVTRSGGNISKYALRWRDWHYLIDLRDNNEKLFHLTGDPGRDVSAAQPEIREFLNARFLAWFAGVRNGGGPAAKSALQSLSAQEIEELKTLGYL